MLQILVQFAGTYLKECTKNKVHWIWVFIFFFFCFVEMFQRSLNYESSLMFFSAEFSVEFSFSCLTWKNFSSRLSFNFTFIFGKLRSRSVWRNLSGGLSFRAFSSVPEFVPRVWIVVFDKKEGGIVLVSYFLGFLLPFPLWPNQELHVVDLIFFLEMNFHII